MKPGLCLRADAGGQYKPGDPQAEQRSDQPGLPWLFHDEQRQRDFHARSFNPGRWQIITTGGTDIGMIDVEYQPAEIYLSRIEIHPDYQGRGIGTRLIGALIDEATRNGQDLALDVLTVNHRAQALYQRLGMTEVARHGDGNIKITMRSSQPHQ